MSDDIADDPHATIARIFDEASAIGQADEGEDAEAGGGWGGGPPEPPGDDGDGSRLCENALIW